MKIIHVVGTRPNFIKIAPLIKEFSRHSQVKQLLVHTGQHYDKAMSSLFFDDLQIPKPDINLGVGSCPDARQTAAIMLSFEEVLLRENPDLVLVVGDVNSTLAASLTAKKCKIKTAHAESGLRSFDMDMPEEINRILTDHVSDFLFTTEESANKNLINEGIGKEKIFFVGNLMIDTLLSHKIKAQKSNILKRLGLKGNEYGVLTLHRPSNVDGKIQLTYILGILQQVQQKMKIVFPIHPRTLKNLKESSLLGKIDNMNNVIITEPLGYLDFLCLMCNSKIVLTDSGGIQEETTVLGVPCITLRDNTERPVTAEQGTNILVSTDKSKIIRAFNEVINGKNPKARMPKFWDGKSAKRIVKVILTHL